MHPHGPDTSAGDRLHRNIDNRGLMRCDRNVAGFRFIAVVIQIDLMISRRETNMVTFRVHDRLTIDINVCLRRISSNNKLSTLRHYRLHAYQQQDDRREEEAELANTHVSSLPLDLVRLPRLKLPFIVCRIVSHCKEILGRNNSSVTVSRLWLLTRKASGATDHLQLLKLVWNFPRQGIGLCGGRKLSRTHGRQQCTVRCLGRSPLEFQRASGGPRTPHKAPLAICASDGVGRYRPAETSGCSLRPEERYGSGR